MAYDELYRRRQTSPPPTTTTGTIPNPEQTQGPVSISQALDDAIANAGGGAGSGPQPIGVGPGFVAASPYQVRPRGHQRAGEHIELGPGGGRSYVAPRYFSDDEYAPANFSPVIISDLQKQMAKIGLYDANATVISGDWGEETASAFRRLLAYSNQHGMSYQVALNNLRAQVEGAQGNTGGTGGSGGRFRIDRNGNLVPIDSAADREPLLTKTTDPRTLNIMFRELSMNLLGQALSPDQVAGMTSAYNQMEVQRQQEAYDKQVTGGSVIDIPSPEAFGQAQLEQERPGEVAANTGLNYMQDAMQMLASPAWGI